MALLIIKYDISEKFQEEEFYEIEFFNDKSSLINVSENYINIDLDATWIKYKDELLTYEGGKIYVQYKGTSKLDSKKIFLIDTIVSRRMKNLNILCIK